MSSNYPNEAQDQELIGKFVGDFLKMFTETKYNLIALNKRFDLIEQCFNNVLLLNSTKAFNEKDTNQNEFEIAPEDIEFINELIEEQSEGNKTNDHLNKKNNDIEHDNLINNSIMHSNKEERNKQDEDNEYIPTCVKPEKKVGKYTEFLKFKQEKEKMLNALKEKKRKKKKKKNDDEEDIQYIGIKRKRSNKKDK